MKKAIFAGGCFWCVEAVFQRIIGVESVFSGYTGGIVSDPTYKQICSGETLHAEAVEIIYNPSLISYDELLKIFWHTHNPTTLNRQGDDVGTQYRSAIFYLNRYQKEKAEKSLKEFETKKLWDGKFVTEITKASEFYLAEDYHQNYFNNNQERTYCNINIAPKISKLFKEFSGRIKDEYQD